MREDLVDRTCIGNLQEPFPLLVGQIAFEHDLAVDGRACVAGLEASVTCTSVSGQSLR